MNRCGESLLEVVVAVSMIMIVLAPAGEIFISSMRNTGTNRHAVVAEGLAQEGVEVMRGFAGSNLLKFSPKAELCWNTAPGHENLDTCETNTIAGDSLSKKAFRLMRNPNTFEFGLEEVPAGFSDMSESFRLRQDVETPDNPACTAPNLPEHCSFHTSVYFSSIDPEFANRGQPSPFYRALLIEYLDLNADSAADNIMRVTSIVQYRNGSKVKTVKLALLLTYPL